jgi:cytoskeleton protein RodZ
MSSTPFGEHLKREREMRGVSLEEIAAATRISTRFLEALESGQWDQLPGGAFNRGFIRSTARFLGLNEDSMVAEYAQETKGQTESKPLDGSVAPMPRDLRPLGVMVGVLFLLIVALAYGLHRYHVVRLRRQVAAASAPAPITSAAPIEGPSAFAPAPQAPIAATPAPSSPPASAGATSANIASDSPQREIPPASGAPEVLKLKIEDGKSARIKVIGDGKKLFDGRLRARTEKRFEARDGFEITSNESSALSLELNGETLPIPSGPPGKPFAITRKDLRAVDGSH